VEADRAAYRAGQSQWRACRAQQLASSGRYTGAASRAGRSSSERGFSDRKVVFGTAKSRQWRQSPANADGWAMRHRRVESIVGE